MPEPTSGEQTSQCPLCDTEMTAADRALPSLLYGTEFSLVSTTESSSSPRLICARCTPRVTIAYPAIADRVRSGT
jgi:hypothetical protein